MRPRAPGLLRAAAGFVLLGAGVAGQQTTLPERSLNIPAPHVTDDSPVLQLPADMPPRDCQISTFLTGPFGGYGTFASRIAARDHPVAVTVGSARARSLKAIVYCRGRAFQLIDLPALEPKQIVIPIRLSPLSDIPLRGAIMFPPGDQPARIALRLTYFIDWGHSFFNIMDGAVPMVDLGVYAITSDGSFDIAVPDFAGDPAITRFLERGSLWLNVVDSKTLNRTYAFSAEAGNHEFLRIPIAPSYPPLRLRAMPVRSSRFQVLSSKFSVLSFQF